MTESASGLYLDPKILLTKARNRLRFIEDTRQAKREKIIARKLSGTTVTIRKWFGLPVTREWAMAVLEREHWHSDYWWIDLLGMDDLIVANKLVNLCHVAIDNEVDTVYVSAQDLRAISHEEVE